MLERFIAAIATAVLFSQTTAVAQPALPNYAPLRDRLAAIGIPVLLPVRLPAPLGPVASIAVIDAERDRYYLGFSSVAHCEGALSCSNVHVAGYRGADTLDTATTHERTLRLPDGTRARYSPRDCSGAGCTEASLRFARGPVMYEIDVKAADDAIPLLVGIYRQLRAFAPRRKMPQNR